MIIGGVFFGTIGAYLGAAILLLMGHTFALAALGGITMGMALVLAATLLSATQPVASTRASRLARPAPPSIPQR